MKFPIKKRTSEIKNLLDFINSIKLKKDRVGGVENKKSIQIRGLRKKLKNRRISEISCPFVLSSVQ